MFHSVFNTNKTKEIMRGRCQNEYFPHMKLVNFTIVLRYKFTFEESTLWAANLPRLHFWALGHRSIKSDL